MGSFFYFPEQRFRENSTIKVGCRAGSKAGRGNQFGSPLIEITPAAVLISPVHR
jgi:hypothetical protein